ncbi:helix-turn-helix domain-containing protein [Rhodococcus sp. ACPA1]|uniref:helix-turn-helix domain-containing protein n=1 Tax=Rhodococcus sp. ACPA1 TaxID=2028572 RepID=UPI000BB12007|nr:helix-turn-helix domain-containing protein [Rhodococcus sp. ACPA1]PBC53468.1 DNA-binding protein [Rhodococcus sp. ACPA1]
MSAQALDQHTYLPQAVEGVGLAEVVGFLDAHERRCGDRVEPPYLLVGAGEHDQVELPAEVHAALEQVVAALQAGRAVTVAPQATMLTTQQAADLLAVSRPTVRRLIDVGELPAEKVGTRHRLLLRDVLEYQQQRRARRYEALAQTAIDIDDEDDPVVVAEQLKIARKAVAERRRTGSAGRSAAAGGR